MTPLHGLDFDALTNSYTCQILLPINCPIRSPIIGSAETSAETAQFSAALEACQQLRKLGELDENFLPLGRDNSTVAKMVKNQEQPQVQPPKENLASSGRPGTTKRRQYYFKQVADSLAEKSEKFCLYAFKMKLSCALPEEQNTRGRKIHPPENADMSFGILVHKRMPPICSFPIYTRDGEIFVETLLIQEQVELDAEQKQQVLTFHKYTFSQVISS